MQKKYMSKFGAKFFLPILYLFVFYVFVFFRSDGLFVSTLSTCLFVQLKKNINKKGCSQNSNNLLFLN
jgi:hypothetical protein